MKPVAKLLLIIHETRKMYRKQFLSTFSRKELVMWEEVFAMMCCVVMHLMRPTLVEDDHCQNFLGVSDTIF